MGCAPLAKCPIKETIKSEISPVSKSMIDFNPILMTNNIFECVAFFTNINKANEIKTTRRHKKMLLKRGLTLPKDGLGLAHVLT